MAAAEALKRIPAAYWTARRVRMAVGDLLPARTVEGVTGPVHRNDVMFASGSGAAEYAATGADAAGFVVRSFRAVDLLPTHGLDLGSGHGRVLRHLVLARAGLTWTACDVDGSAVRFCARAFGVTPLRARLPLSTTPFPPEPYDLVWMGSVVTHLPAPAERDLWETIGRITADEAVVALSILPPAMLGHLESFGPGMGASAGAARDALAGDGFAYVPYPHHRRTDYGVAFHDPERVLARVAEGTGRTVEPILHEPGAWEGMQDYLSFRLLPR